MELQEGFVPFVPPQSDLKQVVRTQCGGNCYIFDTACKQGSREETIRFERALLEAYARHQDKLILGSIVKTEQGKD